MIITGCVIYKDDKGNYIESLCMRDIDFTKTTFLVPHIGETFIDKVRNIEYEVKDIVRTFDGEENCIQVRLHEREIRKYR